jgi:uncharacterized BrkB/YihY/UPF0761 family membrane protein
MQRNRRYATRTPFLAWVYLLFAVIGLCATWYFNLQAFKALGAEFTPLAFIRVGFEGSPILGSLAADFWVGAVVSTIWMVAEGRQLGIRSMWVYVVLALVVAWAFALPLFLFTRERWLSRGGSTARIAAARLTGRSHA